MHNRLCHKGDPKEEDHKEEDHKEDNETEANSESEEEPQAKRAKTSAETSGSESESDSDEDEDDSSRDESSEAEEIEESEDSGVGSQATVPNGTQRARGETVIGIKRESKLVDAKRDRSRRKRSDSHKRAETTVKTSVEAPSKHESKSKVSPIASTSAAGTSTAKPPETRTPSLTTTYRVYVPGIIENIKAFPHSYNCRGCQKVLPCFVDVDSNKQYMSLEYYQHVVDECEEYRQLDLLRTCYMCKLIFDVPNAFDKHMENFHGVRNYQPANTCPYNPMMYFSLANKSEGTDDLM